MAVFSEKFGYEHARLTADGQVAAGQDIVLEHVGVLSGGTAAQVDIYEGSSAVAANKRGGVAGVANNWAWEKGLHLLLEGGAYFDLDANATEIVVVFTRA